MWQPTKFQHTYAWPSGCLDDVIVKRNKQMRKIFAVFKTSFVSTLWSRINHYFSPMKVVWIMTVLDPKYQCWGGGKQFIPEFT